MKKVMILATALTISTTAFASIRTSNSETSFKTEVFATQQQAYNAGFDLVEQFQNMSPNQLAHKLPIHETSLNGQSVKVNDMEVRVEPFAKQPGQVQYRAIVDVDYQFQYRESKRS